MNDLRRLPDSQDIEKIMEQALYILENVGVDVQSERIQNDLIKFGASKNCKNRMVFSKEISKRFLNEFERRDNRYGDTYSAYAEIYEGKYLDPLDDRYKPWTEDRIINYVKLAKSLENVGGACMLGFPVPGFDREYQTIKERIFCWKYGISPGSALWGTEFCDKVYKLYEAYANMRGTDIKKIFGSTVYLLTPLRLAKEEAEQFLWFYDRGLRVNIGALGSIGGSAPVTMQGAAALHIAEQIFLGIFNQVYFNECHFLLAGNMGTMDMRKGIFRFGRPEAVQYNNAIAHIARQIGADLFLHTGLTDSIVPDGQACFEKAVSCIYAAVNDYPGNFAAGLIGVDDVYSPIQMIFDNEMAGYLKSIHKKVNWQEDFCLEDFDEAIEMNSFIGAESTAEKHNELLWKPAIFPRENFKSIMSGNLGNAVDKAKELWADIMSRPDIEPQLTEEEENKLWEAVKSI